MIVEAFVSNKFITSDVLPIKITELQENLTFKASKTFAYLKGLAVAFFLLQALNQTIATSPPCILPRIFCASYHHLLKETSFF